MAGICLPRMDSIYRSATRAYVQGPPACFENSEVRCYTIVCALVVHDTRGALLLLYLDSCSQRAHASCDVWNLIYSEPMDGLAVDKIQQKVITLNGNATHHVVDHCMLMVPVLSGSTDAFNSSKSHLTLDQQECRRKV